MSSIQIPQGIVAIVVTMYWTCVIGMSVRSRLALRVPSGSLPKTGIERLMWLIWIPTIAGWIALVWRWENQVWPIIAQAESGIAERLYAGMSWSAAMVALIAFLLTVRCWLAMGRNWSMAVRPDKETQLITSGAFAYVRHPIYALSLALMTCTMIVVGNWKIATVALVHITMLLIKAIIEEKYLRLKHGQPYLEYLSRTNRFVPTRVFSKRANR
jgi:hypothetical protein